MNTVLAIGIVGIGIFLFRSMAWGLFKIALGLLFTLAFLSAVVSLVH